MAITSNHSLLIKRLKDRSKRLQPDSPKLAAALHRIGSTLSAQMRMNAERQRLRRTGNLINSLKYQLMRRGDTSLLLVGSFGVPYAAIHEFGFEGEVSVRGHNVRAHTRLGRQVKAHRRKAHDRYMKIKARPYVYPAWDKLKVRVYEILRSVGSTNAES